MKVDDVHGVLATAPKTMLATTPPIARSRNSPQQNWHHHYWNDLFLLTSTLYLKIKFVYMNVGNSIFMSQLRLIAKVGLCYTTYK